jgi:hypothetical protein
MMITSPDHHRTVPTLGSTESRAWCPLTPLTTPVSTLTLPITSRLTASHAYQLHRSVLIGSGLAPFTTLSAMSHIIQTP